MQVDEEKEDQEFKKRLMFNNEKALSVVTYALSLFDGQEKGYNSVEVAELFAACLGLLSVLIIDEPEKRQEGLVELLHLAQPHQTVWENMASQLDSLWDLFPNVVFEKIQ